MRRIIVGAQVSMDGVIQAPGARAEDTTNGFRFGGWAMPYFGPEFGEEIDHIFKEKFDLLLGRKTYERRRWNRSRHQHFHVERHSERQRGHLPQRQHPGRIQR